MEEKKNDVVVLKDRKQEYVSWRNLDRRFGLKNLSFGDHGIFFDKEGN